MLWFLENSFLKLRQGLRMLLDPIPMYRAYHWLYKHKLRFLGRITHFVTRVIWSCDINPKAEIEEGTMLAHKGLGVIIASTARIGKRVMICANVGIGGTGRPNSGGPTIEDDVFIGAGARVSGKITVGKGSVIGSNSVVVDDVPPYSLVAGAPARIIRSNINRDEYVYSV